MNPLDFQINNSEIANEIIGNLSNLPNIANQYYDYESGLKMLHALAKFEYKSTFKSELSPNIYPLLGDSQRLDDDKSLANSLKRHSSFSLDHFNKGIYKLRRFEKNNVINLDVLLQQQDKFSKVSFSDLVPKNPEDIIEPHMTRIINLHTMLYDSLYEKGLQEKEQHLSRDEILLKTFSKNINTFLKTGVTWLNKELIRNVADQTRYNYILDSMITLLNNPVSIKQIIDGGSQEDNDWAEFIKKIPIYHQKIFTHISLVCEMITSSNLSRPIFLDVFKKLILNNLEQKDFCFYGLNLFLNLINKEAFAILNKHFWTIIEFREFIVSHAEKGLELIKLNNLSTENKITDMKLKDYTIKYLNVLPKKPALIENLISSFGELGNVAQVVILDKFDILAKEKLLDNISVETLLKLFKNPKNNEKLLMKFLDKYKKDPESLRRYEELLLPEINKLCLENNLFSNLNEILYLNNETEFTNILNQLIISGNDQFFNDVIPVLFEKNKKLAEIMFFQIHMTPENNLIMKIHDIFCKNEKIFLEKNVILEILKKISDNDIVHPLIMRTVLKTCMFYFQKQRNEEIFDELMEIVAKLIDRKLTEDERFWKDIKRFLKIDFAKCKNLIQSLPENYKADYFRKEEKKNI